jgi:hypothetical protein
VVCACLVIAVFHSLERSSVHNRQAARPRIAFRQTPEKAPRERNDRDVNANRAPQDVLNVGSVSLQSKPREMNFNDRLDDELVRKIKTRMESLTEKIDAFLARH